MQTAMINRTIQSQVMFRRPFQLPGIAAPQPAGIYCLTTHQEQMHGVTFITYRTVIAYLKVPAIGAQSAATKHVPISLDDLDAIVRADWEAKGPICLTKAI